MLNNIMIGRYFPIKSPVHKMNPLAKIICTLLFIIMSFFANTLQLSVCLLMLLFIIILNTKIPLSLFFKTLKSLIIISLFIIIINFCLGVNYEDIIVMVMRLVLIVLYTSVLTLTTPPNEITDGLESVLSPLKLIHVPVNKMCFSISLALRFIPTIIDEGHQILKSQASRGVDYYHSNLKDKCLAIKSLIIPLFMLTIKKADNLSDAMEVRLYDVNRKRNNFRQNKWAFFDTYLVVIHLLILAVIVVKGIKM